MFTEYVTQKTQEKSEAGRYEENEATYLGIKIAKTNNGEFGGIILDLNKYEGKSNHIEIAHERTRQPNEPLTEDGQAILRSELGKLMWVARIARPGAIYDPSAAAQTFADGNFSIFWNDAGGFGKCGNEVSRKEKKRPFRIFRIYGRTTGG